MHRILKPSVLKSVVIASGLNRHHHHHHHTLAAYNLKNHRSLISVKGPDAPKFLQGLITNDIHHLNIDHRIEYSMVLNNRGRVMLDVLIYYLKSETPHFLIEVDSTQVDNAIKFFSVFKIKRKIELNDTKNEYQLFSITNHNENETIDLRLRANNADCVLLHHVDPRYKQQGVRVILKNEANVKISEVVENTNEMSSIREYKKYLYQNGIAEGADVFTYGNSIPLEYNIVYLNGVSFNKGCYLGQELVAKTHHTGVIRKRIMPLKLIKNENLKESTFSKDNVILNTKSGQSIGKLKGIIDNQGLALIRLAHIDNGNMAIVDNDGNRHPIRVHVPKYWQMDEALLSELKAAKFD